MSEPIPNGKSTTAAPTGPSRTNRGRGGNRGSTFRGSSNNRFSSTSHGGSSAAVGDEDENDEEVRGLRSKYGKDQLPLIKELFPDWSDVNLLYTLKDAGGDLETAITRISEGHAQQWEAAKPKKAKTAPLRETAQPTQNFAAGVGRGGARTRGETRGRGGFAGRGGRGVGRGGYSAPSTRPEPASTNGSTSTPTLDLPSASTEDAPLLENGVDNTDTISNAATAGGDTPALGSTPAPVESAAPSAAKEKWGGWGQPRSAPAPKQTSSSLPTGPKSLQTPFQSTPSAASAVVPAPALDVPIPTAPIPQEEPVTVTATPSAPVAPSKPAPSRPTPNSARSWAQIARPIEKPKPAPQPTQQIPSVPEAALPPPVSNVEVVPETHEEESDYIVIPSQNQTSNAVTDIWASTPAAAQQENVTTSSDIQEVNINQQTYHHAAGSPDLDAAMPPHGEDPAGPILLSDPASEEQTTQEERPVAAQLEAQVAASEHHQDLSSGPPGFAKKNASPVAQKQEAPGVLERVGGAVNNVMDRVGVQFGSLGLFEQGNTGAQQQQQSQQEESRPHQDMQEHSSYQPSAVNEARPNQYEQPASHPVAATLAHQQQHQQQPQMPTHQYSQQGYPGQHQYSHLQHQQQQAYAQPSPSYQQPGQNFANSYLQSQLQQPGHHEQHSASPFQAASGPAPSASPYAALGSQGSSHDQTSPYFQGHAPSPAHAMSQQQQGMQQPQASSAYNAFNSLHGAQQPIQQQSQSPFAQPQDYSQMYGMQQQDSLRNASSPVSASPLPVRFGTKFDEVGQYGYGYPDSSSTHSPAGYQQTRGTSQQGDEAGKTSAAPIQSQQQPAHLQQQQSYMHPSPYGYPYNYPYGGGYGQYQQPTPYGYQQPGQYAPLGGRPPFASQQSSGQQQPGLAPNQYRSGLPGPAYGAPSSYGQQQGYGQQQNQQSQQYMYGSTGQQANNQQERSDRSYKNSAFGDAF